ncbi:5'-3' exonuclease H3TH domain-containing protein [Oceanobacter mangrovi]|uniref:5'-3' exonuclease H3TH domain-containing protein n=1 Tax=Oceanobacter mangrovi TaxID=2862510 RepID=UPI001C8CF44F|nr:5'-3' exonuclease H3TH domain-containing protein [Oceanobacter mangrovi]
MKLLIVDAMNLIRRVYAAVENTPTALEATLGRCIATIHNNLEWLECSHVAMVFESEAKTWRHDLWPDYKKGRSPMPDALHQALEDLRRQLQAAGIHCLDQYGWEADDVCAALARRAQRHGISSVILSTDKGFFQLVGHSIQIANHFDRKLFDAEGVHQRYGLAPQQLPDFWALTGDTTNHLPGVTGFGPKTAGAVLDACGSLNRALIQLDQLTELAGLRASLVAQLQQDWQLALLTRELATLTDSVPIELNFRELRAPRPQ